MHIVTALVVVCSLFGDASVRPVDARGVRVFERGLAASSSFRALVAEVRLLRAVAYVKMDPYLARDLRGVTRLLNASGDTRMMVVLLNPRASDTELVGVLAHELQHVIEMARAGVASDAEVEAHYRLHGIALSSGRYDTTAALEAGSRVRNELASSGVRAPHSLLTANHAPRSRLSRARGPGTGGRC